MAIELMNVKGNITLGGAINGQVELDNTLSEEIRDMLASGKHIQTITSDLEKERKVIDLWDLESGIYYLEGGTYGFYGDMTHGTNLGDNSQRVSMSSGSILIIGSGLRASEIDKNQDLYVNIKRSFLLIGGASVGVSRFSSGTLDFAIGMYSGSCNLVETIASRVNVIDDKARTSTYPNTKAVKNYVDAAIAGIEIPEASGGIIEIDSSEDCYIYDYPSGVYSFDGLDTGTCFWMSDESYVGLIKGIAIITQADPEIYEWIYIGLDATYFSCSTKGTTYFDSDNECWIVDPYGEIETKHSKISNVRDEYINNEYYPSTLGLKTYVEKQFKEKLVPIEIDVGSEHADNEYYNATAVDQVLIEVVGLMEEMMEYLETFARGLDELNARVEALESK